MEKLYLGVFREIITPPIGTRLYGYSPDVYSKSINDDLTVTAFYFKQGKSSALLISVTVCEINTSLCDELREKISSLTGVSKDNVMLCATHTHSAPDVAGTEGWGSLDTQYRDNIFVPKILSCVQKAVLYPKKVTAAFAHKDSYVGINRRQLLANNMIDFGQNPWGYFNPKMTVVSFFDENNDNVANIVHYGCHGTAAGCNTEITRDWSGIMTDALEEYSGGITAFVNGTMGDAGPRISNGKTTGDISYVKELGLVAANDVVEVYKTMPAPCDVKLCASSKKISIPVKPRMDTKSAEEMYEFFKDKTSNVGAYTRSYLEKVMTLNKEGAQQPESFETEQTTISVGNVVFTGIPFEIFAQTGFRVAENFNDATVLSVSNTNGFEGYFATQDAICRGGYEVQMFLYSRPNQFCDNADFHLMKQMVRTVKDTLGKEE